MWDQTKSFQRFPEKNLFFPNSRYLNYLAAEQGKETPGISLLFHVDAYKSIL